MIVSDAAVVFDGVWKKFRRGERHDSIRDLIPAIARKLAGRGQSTDLEGQEFWAVRDASFQVRRGQALGIIGPNGAGKSTTLKLLTRILKPTRGACELRGRVGALIEVAAGFHPDLTGRENVFLQGAIMGMRREETRRKFEEIVEFSGISAFIDTPVKRYSSGMSARLGFSIAVHLDPDVLVIDEVLAVGDMAFQQRAFARMQQILSRDIAVIVVSHQLDRIAQLCDRAILLRAGQVAFDGAPHEAIRAYISLRETETPLLPNLPITVASRSGDIPTPVAPGDRVQLEFEASVLDTFVHGQHFLAFRLRASDTGVVVSTMGHDHLGFEPTREARYRLLLELQMNVPRGLYVLDVYMWDIVLQKEFELGVCVPVQVSSENRLIGSAFLAPQLRATPIASQLGELA